eukprot:scaffold276305_cov93-Cyclotella_meneghiniana.AAC.1
MRSLLERQRLLHKFGFKIDTSYDEMMVGGFQRLVNNAELFEKVSFPTVFMLGTGNCCALCGSIDEAVKRCSRCHVMGYCGREHQIEDFERHKRLCKRYQKPGDAL